jgi:hypothetical protein
MEEKKRILSEGEKLAVAMGLFALAVLLWGLKSVKALHTQKVLKEFTHALVQTVEQTDRFYPPTVPGYTIRFRYGSIEDVITVDRKNHRISSKRGFRYTINGTQIECSVKYKGNERYSVECSGY